MKKRILSLVLVLCMMISMVAIATTASAVLSAQGDVDGNGTVGITDVTSIQKWIAGLLKLNASALKVADVDLDGVVDIKDATTIQKHIATIIKELPERKDSMVWKTYYFLMPEEWYTNDKVTGAGYYWWTGPDEHNVDKQVGWPGLKATETDVPGVYSVQVPYDGETDSQPTMINWNNTVDGGKDATKEIFHQARQSWDMSCESYWPGDNDLYPEGIEDFDGMIAICTGEKVPPTVPGNPEQHVTEWFYYYGVHPTTGKVWYGTTKEKPAI